MAKLLDGLFTKTFKHKEKIDLGNDTCLICEKDLDLALEKSFIKAEGDYCRKSPIWIHGEGRLRHFLIYANICLDCFRKVNASPDGVKDFKRKWDKRVDKFRDRLI
jgi:hypothetical protein